MQEAIDRQLIRAQTRAMTPGSVRRATARGASSSASPSPAPVRRGRSPSPGTRRSKPPEREAQIRGVVDPGSGREIPLNDAVSRGIVDFVNGMYVNTITGERIPLDEAVQQGLVRKEGSPLRDVPPPSAQQQQPMPAMAPMPQMPPMPRMPAHPQQQQAGSFTEYHYESSRSSMATHQVSRVPASPDQQVSRVRASAPVSETTGSASAVQSAAIIHPPPPTTAVADYRAPHSVQQSFLGVGPASTDPGGTLPPSLSYTEAVHKGLVDVTHGEFTDPRTGDRMPLQVAVRKGLLRAEESTTPEQALEETVPTQESAAQMYTDPRTGERMTLHIAVQRGLVRGGAVVVPLEESSTEDSLDDSSEMLGDRGTISADDEGDSQYSRDSYIVDDSSRSVLFLFTENLAIDWLG